MRLTLSISDSTGRSIKNLAANEKRSLSSIAADALEFYLREKKRKAFGLKLLELAQVANVPDDIYGLLDEGRNEYHDRP